MLLGAFPPAFEFGVAREHVGGEQRGDLGGRGALAVAVFEDQALDGGGIVGGHFLDGRQAGGLTREDVLGRNGAQVVARVLELHRVAFFRAEVDEDLVAVEVPGGDAAEAPALVLAVGVGFQEAEDPRGGGGQLAFVNDFLQIRVDGGGRGGSRGHRQNKNRVNRLR